MNSSMWQTIGTNNFLHSFHSFHKWLPPTLSCGKCGSTMSIWTISRFRLCKRSWRLYINIKRSFVHFWESYICTEQLDVQEANDSVYQLHRIRDHIVGCWFAYGWFTCARLVGVGYWSAGSDSQNTKTNPSVHTGNRWRNPSTPKIKQVSDQNMDLSNMDQVPSNAHPSEEWKLYILEDNEAVIEMIIKGRSPPMRHVSRTYRVALDW